MPTCMLKDGAELAYADQGAGPPILLVHGWAVHGGFFSDLATRLSENHRVLTLTLRGHDGADLGQAPLTIDTLGEDVAQFLDALDLKGVTALGWSMGAMALWAAWPRVGERIDGIVIEEMSPRLLNDSAWDCGLAGGYSESDVAGTLSEIKADWPAYVARFAPRMFAPDVRRERPELIEWSAREMSRADPAAMASLWASMSAQDFRAALSAISAPMLVIHGADSLVYPDGATEFVARAAPRAQRIVIEGAGHVPHLEAPDAFLNHITHFVRNTRRTNLTGGVNP
ncbi:hydrolase of alpha/beta fold family [alpha proteobacterium U9-1i]|nr:hydrolase of alpha/beta fold family [alpha proteobacterium U9-1i]